MYHYWVGYILKCKDKGDINFGNCEMACPTRITDMKHVLAMQEELAKKYKGEAVITGYQFLHEEE